MLVQMEIGQQFLMLQIDKKITSDDLSILIFKDRIAFCTLEQTLYFDLEKNINSENLGTWINYHNIKKKNNNCILFESNGVVVPEKLLMKQIKIYIYL